MLGPPLTPGTCELAFSDTGWFGHVGYSIKNRMSHPRGTMVCQQERSNGLSEQQISYECVLPNGTTLGIGDSFTIIGERGKTYKFIRFVETDNGSWIDCFGGSGQRLSSRSFDPERVAKVKKDKEAK